MYCIDCKRHSPTEVCSGCGVHLPTASRDMLTEGTLLQQGRYRIEYALGRGGFGITYRATHAVLEKAMAIKEYYPDERGVLRNTDTGQVQVSTKYREPYQRGLSRFLREGVTLAGITHPHVVPVSDFFEENGTAYLVMEFLSGHPLRHEMDESGGHGLSEERVQEVMAAVVSALAETHSQGIFHLDLKPENVMIAEAGRQRAGRVVLIDFGASRRKVGAGDSGAPLSRSQVLTAAYAPPELFATGGADELDEGSVVRVGPESDIFELGMMLHEMLIGKRPPISVDRQAFQKNWRPALAEPWQSALEHALELEQKQRPRDVAAWWEEIQVALDSSCRPCKGDDFKVEYRISAEQALRGGRGDLGGYEPYDHFFDIPPNARHGQVVVIPEGGPPGKNGGPPGDVVVTLRVRAVNDSAEESEHTLVSWDNEEEVVDPEINVYPDVNFRRDALPGIIIAIVACFALFGWIHFLAKQGEPYIKETKNPHSALIDSVSQKKWESLTPQERRERLSPAGQRDMDIQLLNAARAESFSFFNQALEYGAQPASPNALADDGSTVLHLICRMSDQALMEQGQLSPYFRELIPKLLEQIPADKLLNKYQETPLMMAARRGHWQIIELLLNDAKMSGLIDQQTTRPDKDTGAATQMTSLDMAAQEGWVKTTATLLEKGADPNLQNGYGETAIGMTRPPCQRTSTAGRDYAKVRRLLEQAGG